LRKRSGRGNRRGFAIHGQADSKIMATTSGQKKEIEYNKVCMEGRSVGRKREEKGGTSYKA